jgi:S-phase kinase-associated protein 1
LKSDKIEDLVDEWFVQYLNAEKDVLFELIKASNYLDISSLLELSSAKVATMIKGKPIQEIRDFFNIVNDFTAEEEEWVKQESAWAEECF